ncbi:type II secretion system protein [Candidatus Saccharibacteria bacterium]|nr:type II secretion system protein [Candidatus Saccharibacteria bacterium]MBR0430694.1 type II secretion system protein [Candidatus Saccharibacteria bacterium]
MNKKQGFTILEIIIVSIFATLLVILFFIQKSNIDAMERDEDRKIAINAMYYALEESFYKNNGFYPETISEENIKVIDPALWTDPLGYNLGDPMGSYSYEAANCKDGKCKEYVLKAILEKEDTYIKYHRN